MTFPSDEELLRRAVLAARPADNAWRPGRHAVMEAFSLGSTYARQLCARFDVDPDANVKRR